MENEKMTYLIYDGKLYKIGSSKNPEGRLRQLKTANPSCELLCYGSGVTERWLHDHFFRDRIKGEWFRFTKKKVEYIKHLIQIGNVRGTYEGSVGEDSEWGNFLDFLSKWKPKMSLEGKKKISDGIRKKHKKYEKSVISFGKYKGTKLTDMTSKEQLEYCLWLRKERITQARSKRGMRNDVLLQELRWWVGEAFKEGGRYFCEASKEINRSKYSANFSYGRHGGVHRKEADSHSPHFSKYLRT